MDFQTYENLAEEADNAGKDQTKERLELEVLQAKDEVVDNLEQKKRFFLHGLSFDRKHTYRE